MLEIVSCLENLHNFLCGAKKIKILTDHQPLTFALSTKNKNAKLKRWKGRIEEYNYELVYKPGMSNIVADALSRLPRTNLHNLTTISESEPEVEPNENNERRNSDTLIASETDDNVLPEIESSSSSGTAHTGE